MCTDCIKTLNMWHVHIKLATKHNHVHAHVQLVSKHFNHVPYKACDKLLQPHVHIEFV